MIKKGLAEITGTIDAVETLGKLSRCKVDLGIVRGIGYYDGMVFEAYDQAGEDVGSIFGGGRFDKLCRIYGKRDMPATGVAGGVYGGLVLFRLGNLCVVMWRRLEGTLVSVVSSMY